MNDARTRYVHALLHVDCAAHGIHDAGELDKHAIAGCLYDAATMLGDFRVNQFPAMRFKARERTPANGAPPRSLSDRNSG